MEAWIERSVSALTSFPTALRQKWVNRLVAPTRHGRNLLKADSRVCALLCQELALPASKRAGRFPSASEANGIFDKLPRPIQSNGVGRLAHFDRGTSGSGG